MAENNFDEQVRRELEKFRLRPSAPVWEKIEEELREKKRRRVIFFFFLLIGIGLIGYSGYTLLDKPNPTNPHDIAQYKIPVTDELNKQVNQVPDRSRDVSVQAAPLANGTINQRAIEKPATLPVPIKSSEVRANEETVISNGISSGVKNNSVNTKPGISVAEKIAVPESQQEDALTGNSPIAKPSTTTTSTADKISSFTPPNNIPAIAGNAVKEVKVGTVAESKVVAQATTPVAKTTLVDSTPIAAVTQNTKPKNKAKASKKIQWFADLSAGISGLNNGGGGNASPGLSFGGVTAPGAPSNVPGSNNSFNSPSPAKANGAFRAGIIASKNISKNIDLFAGLRYTYYSTSIKVGSYSYSAVTFDYISSLTSYRNVYTGYQQKSYSNQYNFLQIPIGAALKLNSSKRLPITWQLGANFSRLITSKNLIYSEALGGIYYKDNKALNKTHVELNTGFQFTVSRKLGLSVGPEVSFDTRTLIKESYGKKQQLLYGGITARMHLFGK